MAATDKHYRSPYTLDVVFGVSCLLLLGTTFWMLYDDHAKPFKRVQREFRNVEATLYQQAMLDEFRSAKMEEIQAAQNRVDEARAAVEQQAQQLDQGRLNQLELEKAKLQATLQDRKATYDSEQSLYNIAVDDRDAAPEGPKKEKLDREAQEKKALLASLDKELRDIQEKIALNEQESAKLLYEKNQAEKALADAEAAYKKLTDKFDRSAKVASQKVWKTFDDGFRALPIIDGFASPYRVQQYTLEDLTIEYGSFKNVPRYDRCTTCHLGIERPNFSKAALAALNPPRTDEEKKKFDERREEYKKALTFLKERAKKGEKLGFDVDDLEKDLLSRSLTDAQIKQYCAHPRLDLFVDSNSPHPVEKFGCTACHAGQGSATEFKWTSHTPNDARQTAEWKKEHDWAHNEYWEFPMLPSRFVESSCLKCHHQVTDLIRYGSREEAPKLIKGYNLVRENGCFGCHEIAGTKGGRSIGPDLRLEPWPPMEARTPEERAQLLADTANPPGTLRKVGPSLRRLVEKTNEAWTRKWIDNPRGFRPDTRMPHFYNLSTNSPDVLPEEQKKFPAAEVHAITHYLFAESKKYLDGTDVYRRSLEARRDALKNKADRTAKEAEELAAVERRLELFGPVPKKVTEQIVDGDLRPVTLPAAPKDDKARQEAITNGRRLFTERGCLACHSHQGTETAADATPPIAAVTGEATFGPNLSRLAAKLGKDDAGRRWLIQWILNPNVHFSRTRMPITHLTPEEASQVADWLLGQEVKDWNQADLPAPDLATLKDLARVYLKKAPNVTILEVDTLLETGFPAERAQAMAVDADERALEGPITEDKLKYYIGKKSISRLGCFGCHDIPGFEGAKPIGTALNDWGKKDPARLAFEDAAAFVKDHYNVVELRDDPKDRSKPAEDWVAKNGKPPFEEYFEGGLHHGHFSREAFLHLKLMNPRSYDYHREVKWDDRLRMPQFKFAHSTKKEGESDEAFAARADKEEAEAREAVMTFVLGLVAEPVHARYLYSPGPDKLAEAKGRQVLDKFNCAGCHQVRPGAYDLKVTNSEALEALTRAHRRQDYKSDFDVYKAHNAWSATQTQSPERALVLGFPPRKQNEDEGTFEVRLTHALRLADPSGKEPMEFRAGSELRLPKEAFDKPEQVQPYGGAFVERLMPYLSAKDRTLFALDQTKGENNNARAALPPPLVREGEKVQPDWLFRFLKDPGKVRPLTILRMPRFNMSDEDARALVDYFNGVDRSSNPGIGLTYPYVGLPQREEAYWRDETKKYVAALGKDKVEAKVKAMQPVWERAAKDTLAEAEQRLAAAKATLADVDKRMAAAKAANKPAVPEDESVKKRSEQEIAETTKLVNDLKERIQKGDYSAYRARYLETEIYATDAYRLLSDRAQSLCLQCHRVGSAVPEKEQGPPLETVFERMRPDWVERWIATPNRLITYTSVMPQNFPRDKDLLQHLFEGKSLEQVKALRDVLMNYPKVSEMPGPRYGVSP